MPELQKTAEIDSYHYGFISVFLFYVGGFMMFIMIDNYDSFVYNLSAYFQELGQDIKVIRNDKVTINELKKIEDLSGIIISPGPGNPKDGGISEEVIKYFCNKIPILGVCLGHQIIGQSFGAKVCCGTTPIHGKVTEIENNGKGIFNKLPKHYNVTRYHSLVVDKTSLPSELNIDAISSDGAIMAISHCKYPVYGIQFHPEAVLTENGHEILNNFIKICQQWRYKNCL